MKVSSSCSDLWFSQTLWFLSCIYLYIFLGGQSLFLPPTQGGRNTIFQHNIIWLTGSWEIDFFIQNYFVWKFSKNVKTIGPGIWQHKQFKLWHFWKSSCPTAPQWQKSIVAKKGNSSCERGSQLKPICGHNLWSFNIVEYSDINS